MGNQEGCYTQNPRFLYWLPHLGGWVGFTVFLKGQSPYCSSKTPVFGEGRGGGKAYWAILSGDAFPIDSEKTQMMKPLPKVEIPF